VPAFNARNALPPNLSLAEMDRLVRATSLRRYPPVPTAVGFCMLMTRHAIEEVGERPRFRLAGAAVLQVFRYPGRAFCG
jgi:hypothetical protein